MSKAIALVALFLASVIFRPNTLQRLPEGAIAWLNLQSVLDNSIIFTFAWSPNGDAITLGSVEGKVIQWYIEDNTIHPLQEFSGYPVRAIGLSSAGLNVAWVLEETDIALWRSAEPLRYSYFRGEHTDMVMQIAFSPDGSLLASVADLRDSSAVIWDIETGEPLHKLEIDEGHFPFSVAFSPDGSTLAIGRIPSAVELWDVETGTRLDTLTGLSFEIASIVWSPNGNIVAASAARLLSSTAVRPHPPLTIAAWDVTSGKLLYALEPPPERVDVYQVALSPDGWWLASGAESGEIHIWDFENGELLDTLEGHTDNVLDLAWSPDGQMLASISADNMVIVWKNPFDIIR